MYPQRSFKNPPCVTQAVLEQCVGKYVKTFFKIHPPHTHIHTQQRAIVLGSVTNDHRVLEQRPFSPFREGSRLQSLLHTHT